jgi:predicted ester cyclase
VPDKTHPETPQERAIPLTHGAAEPAIGRAPRSGLPPVPGIIAPMLSDAPSRRTMPTDYSIAVRPAYGRDTARAERERGERAQSMRGFEDTYVDIVDYIIRITHRIWEDQDVGYIYDTYAPGAFVFDDHGAHYGVERVVTGTMDSIHAFPDTRSWADEVIWAGNDEEGFATSHRYITSGHHLGAWRWGPATGKVVNLWGIANCVIRENEIFEEWVLYNMCSKLSQLGIDVRWAAREYGNELNAQGRAAAFDSEVERLARGLHPEPYPRSTSERFDVDHFVRALLHDVYNRRDLSAIDRAYARNARWRGTSDRHAYGHADIKGHARALLSTFPDLGMHVDEIYWMGNDAEGFRVSVRWSAAGTHRGYALYGTPSQRRVSLWGMSQLYIVDGRITEEWNLFNEFDVLAQILADAPRSMFAEQGH